MTTLAPLKASGYVILSKAHGDFKHSGKYYLLNGRWHKLHADKKAPKGSSVAADPHVGGQHAPAKHFTDDQWAQLKLPDGNVNAKSYNKQLSKLKEASEAGHVSGILGMQFGINTYGKKAAAVANKLLEMHGSPHKVTPGQKAGEHAAVSGAPASAETPAPAQAPASSKPKPEKPDLPLSDHWQSVVDSIDRAMDAGDVDKIQQQFTTSTGMSSIGAKATHDYAGAALAYLGATPEVASQKAASAKTVKHKGVEYTKQPNGGWLSADGEATPSSPMGVALSMASGSYPDISGKSDIQKEVIVDLLVGMGKTPEAALKSIFGSGNAGPKEGDTKTVNGVTYKLINGRWHKQGEDEEAAQETAAPDAHPIDAVPDPDLSGFNNPTSVQIAVNLLKAKIKAEGPSALKGTTKKMASGKLITKLPHPQYSSTSYKISGHVNYPDASHTKIFHYVEALKAAAGKPPKTSKPKPAANPKATPAVPDHSGIPSMDSWEQTGPQGGSNPGGRFKDEHGVDWYCKFPADEDVAKSEVLAAKLYQLAGVAGQDAKLIVKDGKLGIASRWTDVSKVNAEALAATDGVQSGFAVDAWLGNWDVVGLGYDNLQVGADGKAMRVDAGGSLQYRAQGGKKVFGDSVIEIDSLRDAKINPQAASVFGSMTKADITASVKKVADIADEDIYSMVMEYGPGDMENKANLIDTLIARKADLLEKFPKAVKKEKAKPKPDPTKLTVDKSQLPQPHDFKNWGGEGKGLSSKEHVNELNLKAEQDLLAFAATGNLIALKDYHFESVDKETGAPTGSKPIDQHPSQHVKTYWSDLVSTLSFIAFPPEPLKKFKSVVAGSVKKVSEAFKSAGYGVTTNKVDANSRLAFWIALGHTKPAEALLPPGSSLEFQSTPTGTPSMTSKMKMAAKDAYSALSYSRPVQRFINGIQGSGSYNDNFRDGRMVTNDGHDAVGMVLDAYEYATEKPEGFEIFKWVSFPGDMGKQLLNTPVGTVFQNPGSMCCSYDATATSGFGPDRMRIRYAKGAKAVDSFGSGSFKSEQEITTLPGQRYVILSCKKVMCPVKGKERIELDVLMLPPDESYVSELQAQKGIHGKVAA